jgi:hypothetical protein
MEIQKQQIDSLSATIKDWTQNIIRSQLQEQTEHMEGLTS